MHKSLKLLIVIAPLLLSYSLIKSASAIKPEIHGILVYDDGVSTFLNITIYHAPESSEHYADKVNVTMGSNTTELSIDVQPQTTFTITYNLGPVSGTPTVSVGVHCKVDGWNTSNWGWTGQIPEFSSSAILLTLTFAASLALVTLHKMKLKAHQ